MAVTTMAEWVMQVVFIHLLWIAGAGWLFQLRNSIRGCVCCGTAQGIADLQGCDVLPGENGSTSNLDIMGDQLCWTFSYCCQNLLKFCVTSQVERNCIYVSGYALKEFMIICCLWGYIWEVGAEDRRVSSF